MSRTCVQTIHPLVRIDVISTWIYGWKGPSGAMS
jgi:hypothetical protein